MGEIHIQIRLEGDGFPTPDEMSARHDLEDAIEDAGLGEVVAAGSGGGVMDIHIEVADIAAVRDTIWGIVEEHGLAEVTRMTGDDD